MPVVAVIGGQWGDEGKGKIIDLLAERADVVIRFSGGNNAGHTVINQAGEFRLHLIPAGIFNPNTTCLIGAGLVVDPKALLAEIDDLTGRGVSVDRLVVSDRAQVLMPYHQKIDQLDEAARGSQAIGTTQKGIGPAYIDKVARRGIRFGQFIAPDRLRATLEAVLPAKDAQLSAYGAGPIDREDLYNSCVQLGERLRPFVTDCLPILHEAIEQDRTILLEGAQGTMLDIDYGTYPYVTSSSPTAAGAAQGAGIPPRRIDRVVGVFKAYTTRVGGGPFPTELTDAIGDHIRERGNEYGTTTGRPRRCGWFDAVAAAHSMQINGFTGIALTRLDILDELPTVRICTAYRITGRETTSFPAEIDDLARVEPVYEDLPGWQSPTYGMTELAELPKNARAYVDRLAALIGCDLDLISTGPARHETITLQSLG
ncbi:MAG TPA: adenylosuccinate synthase [Dehalococcoidia bacterium]|nr:adenylosuccinate synthase [Dehalococcoidia bacterium]